MAVMAQDELDTVGKRARWARKERRLTQEEVAELVGVGKSAISNLENGRSDSTRFVVQMAKALSISPEWLSTGKGPVQVIEGRANIQLSSLQPGHKTTHLETNDALIKSAENLGEVAWIGEVRAGAWMEVEDFNQDEPPLVEVQILPEHQGLKMFSVTVRGSSMDKVFGDGTVLVCARTDNGIQVKTGDYVVVERHQAQGGLVERSIKQLEIPSPKEYLLWPRSTDPRWQEPLEVHPAEQEETGVVVIGVVLYEPQKNFR